VVGAAVPPGAVEDHAAGGDPEATYKGRSQ
jgi:hypothetical protein